MQYRYAKSIATRYLQPAGERNVRYQGAHESFQRERMRIIPFESVGEIKFSASREDVIATLGQPNQEMHNKIGLLELTYQNIICRLDKSGAVEEITAYAPILSLGVHSVLFSALAAYIHQYDHSAFKKHGFLVSPLFGLAFDPYYPPWITAITKHSVNLWKAV